MQSLTFYQDTGLPQQAVINRAQACKGPSHEDIRDAVRSAPLQPDQLRNALRP